MSLPIVEVVKIAVNDAYKQDPSILNEFFGILSKIDGVTEYVPSLSTCKWKITNIF